MDLSDALFFLLIANPFIMAGLMGYSHPSMRFVWGILSFGNFITALSIILPMRSVATPYLKPQPGFFMPTQARLFIETYATNSRVLVLYIAIFCVAFLISYRQMQSKQARAREINGLK